MSDTETDNRKNILWRLLKSAFFKARENVRRREGTSFRVRSPEHFAINVLNEHYGKRKTAKPRNYEDEELEHAIAVARSPGFIDSLERAIAEGIASEPKETAPPETPAAPEPARPASAEEPAKPREPVKATESKELQKLRGEIERAGGEVAELKRISEGVFSYEVATPLAVYWGKDTREEILRQVERDVAASRAGVMRERSEI